MRRFVIDTDTASDDAVALVMALQHPDVQVEAITVVAGNVPVEQSVQNALYTVEQCGKSVPVYSGLASPILYPLETAHYVHGNDGMGDIGLPLAGRKPAKGRAVDIIIQTINQYPGQITLVTLGPLTNVAFAILFDSSIAHKVKECVLMGGVGYGIGNVSPVAEYNIWVDPQAAKIVFDSGMHLKMVGWDVSKSAATILPADEETIRNINTPLAEFCMNIQHTHAAQARDGFVLADPIAMAVALDETVAEEIKRLYVAIETQSELCRGQTVVDHNGVLKKEPNVDVVLAASKEKFLDILRSSVKM